MKKCLGMLFLFFLSIFYGMAESRKINSDWHFHLGDFSERPSVTQLDTTWQIIHVPHDWAFENGYHEDGAQRDKGGYACGGIGWYAKTIQFTAVEKKAKRLFLDFEAVYMNSDVWFNGHHLGHCTYGYLPFSYEITSLVKEDHNELVVRVDNSQEPSARWYHGCGIYGNVYLRSHGGAYFEKDATFISKANGHGDLSLQLRVQRNAKIKGLRLLAHIRDASGEIKAVHPEIFLSKTSDTLALQLHVDQPRLWSPEHPELYVLDLALMDKHQHTLDQQTIRFGFRDCSWNVQKGFFLNGQSYKLRGVCEHLEGGPTGALSTPQLLRWKLQLLKDMGCNAIRTAHNPQLPMFYDLCDEIGLLVMDEVFDGWLRKADYDYGSQAFAQCWEQDLRTIIRRDRNHPSVFLYSVGNETRGKVAPDLVRVCHEEDSTRCVTSGTAGTNVMDIQGENGHSEFKSFLETFQPRKQPFIGTENPHTWQVRGYYRTQTWYRDGYAPQKKMMMHIPNLTEKEIFTYDWIAPELRRNRKQIFNSSYDNATVRVTARHILEALREKAWFAGSFRWTGFDYLGEAGYVHGGWPFRAFQSGALDLAGFPKDLYYLYQSEWTDKDMVHILPHWSHPMMAEGTVIPVWVYTTGDEVELFHNGKSLGRVKKGKVWNRIQCEFQVPWHPGTLEAVAYRSGKEIVRSQQVTAGAPTQLEVEVENANLVADGENISILTISEQDAAGHFYPYGENRVYLSLQGGARVLSFENGSPVDTECNFGATSRCCFFGKNRIFIQSTDTCSHQPVKAVVAAICGDKKLKQSPQVSISCQEILLRKGTLPAEYQIYYTTDGSQPTTFSHRYHAPFPIKPGTTVRAAVYEKSHLLLQMSERFGPEEGLYWGKSGAEVDALLGEQAENMELTACQIQHEGENFKGSAYVIPHAGKGKISWYQENDGGTTKVNLHIRYALQSKGKRAVMGLYRNNHLVRKIVFADTDSPHSVWKEQTVEFMLQPGANHLSLQSLEKGPVPSIDQVRLEQ